MRQRGGASRRNEPAALVEPDRGVIADGDVEDDAGRADPSPPLAHRFDEPSSDPVTPRGWLGPHRVEMDVLVCGALAEAGRETAKRRTAVVGDERDRLHALGGTAGPPPPRGGWGLVVPP